MTTGKDTRAKLHVKCAADGCIANDKLFYFKNKNGPQMRRKLLGILEKKGWTVGEGGQLFFCPEHSDELTKRLNSKINHKHL